MKFSLHIRFEPLGGIARLRHGDSSAGKNLDCEVKGFLHRWGITGSEAAGLKYVAAFTGKHAFIEHHALIAFLPVEGNELDAATPEGGWVSVGGGESEAEGVYAHEVLFVVGEDCFGVLLVEVCEDFFREGVDMVGNLGSGVGEWGGGGGGEVVRGTVDPEGGESACYFSFLGLGLVGPFGELFELAVRG